MSDLLLESARAYRALNDTEFTFLFGRKGKQYSFRLRFPADAYHHLAGFQYAKGIPALRVRKEALARVLAGQVTAQTLARAGVQERLNDRLQCICRLSALLRGNRFVIRYAGHERPGSTIQADYLLTGEAEPGVSLFFTRADASGTQIPVSIFQQATDTYSLQCPKCVTLLIRETHLPTGTTCEVYRAASYQEH